MTHHIRLILAFLTLAAATLCATAQDSVPTYEQLVEQALNAVASGYAEKAERLFGEALKVSPADHRNALIYTNIGKLQEQTGREEKALQSYSSALDIVPQSVPILTSRADLYLRLGNFSKAAIDYGNIIAADPYNLHALKCRAYIHTKRREYAEAKADYSRVLEISPNDYTASLSIAVILIDTGRKNEAMSHITLLISKYPDKAELYSIRAEMEQEAKQTELAIIDMDKAVELEPDNINYILARAYLHLDNGNKFYARRDFNRAIELGVPRSSLKEELKKVR
jgi:tetratricopeptide (TPR) repeat protein